MTVDESPTLRRRRLGAELKRCREAAGLTQRDLGAALGRPQSWVNNCETANRRVDVTEFAAWAAACGIALTPAPAAADIAPVDAKSVADVADPDAPDVAATALH